MEYSNFLGYLEHHPPIIPYHLINVQINTFQLCQISLGLRQFKGWTFQNVLPPFLVLTTPFSPIRRDKH